MDEEARAAVMGSAAQVGTSSCSAHGILFSPCFPREGCPSRCACFHVRGARMLLVAGAL